MGTTKQRSIALLLAIVLLIVNTADVDGKRLSGGGRSRGSSSSGSRRTSHTSHSSHSSPSYTSHSSPSYTSHSSPSYTSHSSPSHTSHTNNHDLTRLSYANTHSQAPGHTSFGSSSTINRGTSSGTNVHHQPSAPAAVPHATATPIGWNVPKNQGPPPAYSPVNPAGGAKTNLHESPPPYRPNSATAHNPSAPPYPGATNTNTNTNTRPFTPAQTYPRFNSTGGFGGTSSYNRPISGSTAGRYNSTGSFGSSSNIHTPITATNAGHGVQSGYPRQQVPAGATYYSPNSQLPPGATYHPSGSIPHGATYYPTNSHLPPGATYHPAGQIPPGAHYYPSGGAPAAPYYPAAPAGATYFAPGASLPPGAVFYAQPPKSSSGPGFGTGLAAGALGGALLGHALTPSRTVTHVQPSYAPAPSQGGDDKIIIINNGPPGSVSTTNAGDGVTVINAGQPQAPQAPLAQPAQPAQPYQPSQPAQPAQPIQPAMQPGAALPAAAAALPAMTPTDQMMPNAGAAQPTNPAAAQTEQPPPQPGSIICVPVTIPKPDPNDPTKTIEEQQIACYPAPPPEATTNSTVAPTTDNAAQSTTTTTQAPVTTKDGVVLAPFQPTNAPFVPPEGTVPLAPLNPSAGKPDIMHMPGEPTIQHHSSSEAMLAPGSNVHVAYNAAGKYFDSFAFTSLLSLMLAYCLH